MISTPREESERWLLHAERDLGFARLGLEIGGFYSQSCYMVHQSAEKALKALLYLRGARFVSQTTLSELLPRCADVYPGLNRYQDMASTLDRHYAACRYLEGPGGNTPFELIGEEQAKEAVKDGENLILEIRNIIRLRRA